ncbi:hypothetical protein D918_02629 [Trichuris suis]|nr:hypothetical protein D918_02629 [Trichuris suis]
MYLSGCEWQLSKALFNGTTRHICHPNYVPDKSLSAAQLLLNAEILPGLPHQMAFLQKSAALVNEDQNSGEDEKASDQALTRTN